MKVIFLPFWEGTFLCAVDDGLHLVQIFIIYCPVFASSLLEMEVKIDSFSKYCYLLHKTLYLNHTRSVVAPERFNKDVVYDM